MTAHGIIGLEPAACTSCMICVRECPTWCIEVDSHAEQVSDGRRPRAVNVLDDFRIDFGLCMHCGTCIEVCPFDALSWARDDDSSAAVRVGLVHGKALLDAHRGVPGATGS